MKEIREAILTLYWLALAALPFLPALLAMHETGTHDWTASMNFAHGEAAITAQTRLAGVVIAVLLWPLCLWNLGGRWLWHKLTKR